MMDESSIRIGVDLLEIDRVARTMEQFGDRFLGKLFWPEEADYYRRGSKRRFREGIAGLFAAKEAVRKLFLPVGVNLPWKAVLITHDQGGGPVVTAEIHPFSDIQLSLSHTGGLVMAVAVGIMKSGKQGTKC